MSLFDKKPPYSALDVEEIARRLAHGEAYMAWFCTDDFNKRFAEASRRKGLDGHLAVQEGGGILAVEFLPPGKRVDNANVIFATYLWLDEHSARAVLMRRRELMLVQGEKTVPIDEIELMLASFEKARVDALPELRKIVQREKAKSN